MVLVDQAIVEEIKILTQQLVEIPSDSKNLVENEKCLKFVTDYLKGTSWKTKRIQKTEGSSPMLYITGDVDKFHTKLLLLVHLDVVPHKEYKCHGDFSGKITGRGVSDMKGPSACLLHILKKMNPFNYDMAMLVVTDEEIGGIDGAKFAFQDSDGPKISCDICHCPDGGDFFKVVTAEKGVLRFLMEVEGKASHSAYPWLGVNAIEKLMNEYSNLKSAKDKEGNFVFDQTDLEWHTTINLSTIKGGTAINVVPGNAVGEIDIRFTEIWTIASLKELIGSTLKNCKVSFLFEQNMLYVGEENKYVQDAKEVLEKELNRKVMYSRGHGTSDGHWAEFPTVMFKPDGGGLHQDSEWVDFPSLITYYGVSDILIEKWAK